MSIIALWALVLFETVLLLLLLRALGQLRQQGKLTSIQPGQFIELGGLDIGEPAPSFEATNFEGNVVRLDDYKGKLRILAFTSPDCSVCAGAINGISEVLQEEPEMTSLVLGSLERKRNRAYAAEHDIQIPILTPVQELEKGVYHVQIVPFVFVLDEAGIIRAKGVVNDSKQLRQLLVSASLPIPASL